MNLLNLSDPVLLNTANNVAFSIQIALNGNPSTPQSSRNEAYKFCDNFRVGASPNELACVGLILTCRNEVELIVSGLQFLEHVAKYQWTNFQERGEMKERLILLMQNGFPQFPTNCPTFIQEALARVIVEIAKREWPQLWPDLMQRLCEMSNTSEIPLLVLRRMAEDVFTLQIVDSVERRRELSQGLIVASDDVIRTLFNHLVNSVQSFRATAQDGCIRRGQLCLSCLLPFIEWITPSSFLKDNRIFILLSISSEGHFKLGAIDCLLQLLERKPAKKETRCDIPQVFLEESCALLMQSIIASATEEIDFLRKLGDILTLIAANSVKDKVNIANLIKCMETLASREEAASVLGTATAINQLLKIVNKVDCEEGNPLSENLINLLNLICKKFVSSPPKPSEKEDMAKLKCEFSMMIRSIGKLMPKLYTVVNSWLHNSLNSPTAVQLYQWEALVLVIDSVASSVSHEDKEIVKIGLMDLEQCYLKFDAETSLEIKSVILSNVSALFVFLSLAKKRSEFGDSHQKLLLSILESVFKSYAYDESAREIRRHSSALLIKLAAKFPELLEPAFDFIHSSASAVSSRLSPMEYNSIAETLLMISNSWNDNTRQSAFIESLLPQSEWSQVSLISHTPQTLGEIFQENIFFEKRGIFLRNLNVLHSVLRRVKKPKYGSPGGALNSSSTNTSIESVQTHPAFHSVCPILPVILKLVKTIHSLIENTQFQFLFTFSDQERAIILGTFANMQPICKFAAASSVDVEKSFPEKLKTFIQTIQELCYGILGECASVFGQKFYSIPQLSDAYLNFVGWNSQLLSDFRLRGILRSVYKPFLVSCPLSYALTNVVPFARSYFPFMQERLVEHWTLMENSRSVDAEGEEEKEVLENSVLRLLAKEYVDLIFRLMDNSVHSGGSTNANSHNDEHQMDKDVDMMDGQGNGSGPSNGQPAGNPEEISEIGRLILTDPICYRSILQFCVTSLCWNDGLVALKASRCIMLAWTFISTETEIVHWVFVTSLRAACLWNENDANVDVLLRIIDHIFKTTYDKDMNINHILLEWGAPAEEVKRLSEHCQNSQGTKNDKKRKDLFRKLIHNNPNLEKNKVPKALWPTGLPSLIIQNREKILKQNPIDIDLNECFSMIHK